MTTQPLQESCTHTNLFTEIYQGSIKPRLPEEGSLADRALSHTTATRQFFETVSRELCDEGRTGRASAQRAISFITRSATSAGVLVGTISLAGIGLVVGSPLAAIAAGAIGLCVLPPITERLARGAISIGGEILKTLGASVKQRDN